MQTNIQAVKKNLQVFGLEDVLLVAATAAKLPDVDICDNNGELSRAVTLLGVLLTNVGLLLGVDVVLLLLEFNMELLLLLFNVVLDALTAVGFTGCKRILRITIFTFTSKKPRK